MTQRRTAILVLSLLIGSIAAFLTYVYVNSEQERAYKGAELVRVLVVKGTIDKETPSDQALAKGLIKADSIPTKFRPETAVTDTSLLQGKVALTQLTAGQVLVQGMFVDPRVAQITAAKRIPEGQVAVTVQLDAVRGVANLVVPGDKVNIMAATPDGTQRTLFENVDVLFIGATPAPETGSTEAVPTPAVDSNLITFAVPQLAAQKIVFAARQDAGIYLTLVPPGNQAAPVPPVNAGNLFGGGPTPYEG